MIKDCIGNTVCRLKPNYRLIIFGLAGWLLIFGLNACKTTSPVVIEVLSAPEKPFPWSGNKMLVVNRIPSILENLKNDSLKAGNILFPSDYLKYLSWESVNACIDELSDSPVVDSIVLDTLVRSALGGISLIDPPPLSPELAVIYCNTFHANGLITLEGLQPLDTLIFTSFLGGDDPENVGWVTYVQEMIKPNTLWRAYGPNGKLIIESVIKDSLIWDGVGVDEKDAVSTLPETDYMLVESMKSSGISFVNQIAPVWNRVRRFYYLGNSTDMRKAAALASKGDWMAAAAIWKKIVQEPKGKSKTKALACFNMALVSEINDKLELALDWINNSYKLYPQNITKRYGTILRQRLTLSKSLENKYKDQ